MLRLQKGLFANPVWQALQTHHRRFARSAGDTCRYPADFAPFAPVAAPTASALEQRSSLLEPEEALSVVVDSIPSAAGLRIVDTIAVLQMAFPDDVTPPTDVAADVELLRGTNVGKCSRWPSARCLTTFVAAPTNWVPTMGFAHTTN
jgi:hypothetical protein